MLLIGGIMNRCLRLARRITIGVFVLLGIPWDCGVLKVAYADSKTTEKLADGATRLEWHIVPLTKAIVTGLAIALPPLAVVESRDDSGKTWRLSGRASGSPAVARQDFKLALEKQGWRLDKVIPVGQSQRPSNLCLWKKGQQSIMLMLWEDGAGRSGFALGMDQ